MKRKEAHLLMKIDSRKDVQTQHPKVRQYRHFYLLMESPSPVQLEALDSGRLEELEESQQVV
jgi:hypothetical protein